MADKTHKVLIVDDDVINLWMLERLLGSRYDVLTAANGPAALEILKRDGISLLISDQRMPGMSDIELQRASEKVNQDMVSILVTDNTDGNTALEATDAGALRVIHKPWNPETVLQFVQDALAQRETLIGCK